MQMYNLIRYIDNYLKTSGNLWECYRLVLNDILAYSESFKYRIKVTGRTPAAGKTKDVKIAVPLTYLSHFWRTLEMSLIHCELCHYSLV